MNRLIEIHDSTLGAVVAHGTDVEVHFSPAYVHASEGKPGVDRGTGWTQHAVLHMRNGRIEQSPSDVPLTLMDGDLIVGGDRHDNTIPIPFDTMKRVQLLANGPNDQVVRVSGDGAELKMIGSPKYVEEFG